MNEKLTTIQNKILKKLIPAVAILLIGITVYNCIMTSINQKKGTIRSQEQVAERVASEVSTKLNNFVNELRWLAEHEVITTMDQEKFASVLNDHAEQKKDDYCLLFVCYPDGSYYVANSGMSKSNIKDREYFKDIMIDKKQTSMTSPDISKSTGEMKYTVAVPIKRNGELVGLLAANVSLNTLSNIIDEIMKTTNAIQFIVDEDARVIAHYDKSKIMNYNILTDGPKDFEGADLVGKAVIEKKTVTEHITDRASGDTYYMSNFPIKNTPGWYLVSGVSDMELKMSMRMVIISMSGFILVILAIIIIITNLTLKNILTKPLAQFSKAIKGISEGHLKQKFDYDSNDEIGQMTQDLHDMSEKLSEIVSSIKEGAEALAEASKSVNESSQQLSQGTATQASGIEELSATMEEMGSNIEQNTMNADQTNKVSQEAYDKFNEVVANIDSVLNTNKEIAEKISIINDIAYQTNILALNAAVEAARAGEYGKGFAVVASEVRKLAENAKKSADEIIEKSQEGLTNSIAANESMHAALPKVESTSILVKEIASASVEQNSGAMQINDVIQRLNSVVGINADSAELLAENAENLANQAENLKEIIDFFKD